MPDPTTLRVADLLVDEQNPRLSSPNRGQRETLRTIAQHQDRKLLKLAEDIVEHGVNPADLFIVTATKDDPPRYTVLEGNRRLCALKALEAPDQFSGAVSTATLTGLRKFSAQYLEEGPIETVRCVTFRNRREAQHWLALRHTGENEGAGIVPWDAEATSRFRAERGSSEPFRQALDFAERAGHLTREDRNDLHTTTFKRLIDTPVVREKLGVAVKNKQLQIVGDKDRVAKAIAWVVHDLIDREVSVGEVYDIKKRQKYAKLIPASIVVKTKGLGLTRPATKGKTNTTKGRPRRRPVRDILIPYECVLTVHDVRCREIEQELRRLSLQEYTNAAAVLFRVFIELSVDFYIQDQAVTLTAHAKLSDKLRAAGEHLLKRTKITGQQIKPVRQAAQKGSYLGPSVTLFNEYVHNASMFPAPAELRSHWNNLQPFFQAVWS